MIPKNKNGTIKWRKGSNFARSDVSTFTEWEKGKITTLRAIWNICVGNGWPANCLTQDDFFSLAHGLGYYKNQYIIKC